jgi:hypothetical protein
MKPVKPRFKDTIKLEVQISPRTKEILTQYAKYTKYSESEIIDLITAEILVDDKDFVQWLQKRRYQKKIQSLVFENSQSMNEDEEIRMIGFEKIK